MTDILNDIIATDTNIARFISLNGTPLYGVYKKDTTVQQLITRFNENYTYNSHNKEFVIFSKELNKILDDLDKTKKLTEFNLSKISDFVVKLQASSADIVLDIASSEASKLVIDNSYKNANKILNNIYDPEKAKLYNYIDQIYAKTISGKTTVLKINDFANNITIADLMVMIANQNGIATDQQRLIYSSIALEPSETLQKYDIQKNSILHLILRLRGGMYDETSGKAGDFKPLQSCIFFI